MPRPDPLAIQIMKLRQASGKSQETFAKEVNSSQGQVSRIESGARVLDLQTARLWLNALGHDLAVIPKGTHIQAARTNPVTVAQAAGAREIQGVPPRPDKPLPKRPLPKPSWNPFLAPPSPEE